MPTIDPTGPPAGLSPPFRALYRKVRTATREQGTWQDVDCTLLASYVSHLEQAASARKLMGGQLTTTGSKGQLVPHPSIRIILDAERAAGDCADRLLLTPRARKQHEIEARKAGKFDKFGLD